MNWGELKSEVRDLGFEEDPAIEEYIDIVASATNRAVHTINLTVLPLVARYDFSQDGTEKGLKRYDMIELTKNNDTRKFLSLADVPVRTNDEMYEVFNDFYIENGHIIIMDASITGNFSIFYKVNANKVNANTDDNTEIEIDERISPALPLLVSYYVWLDDDERKASHYYNRYDEFATSVVGEAKPLRAEIRGGI